MEEFALEVAGLEFTNIQSLQVTTFYTQAAESFQ